jgi:hypothetical protein
MTQEESQMIWFITLKTDVDNLKKQLDLIQETLRDIQHEQRESKRPGGLPLYRNNSY